MGAVFGTATLLLLALLALGYMWWTEMLPTVEDVEYEPLVKAALVCFAIAMAGTGSIVGIVVGDRFFADQRPRYLYFVKTPSVPVPTPSPTPVPTLVPSTIPTNVPTTVYARFGYALTSSLTCEKDDTGLVVDNVSVLVSTGNSRLNSTSECAAAAAVFGYTFFNSVRRKDRPGPGCCKIMNSTCFLFFNTSQLCSCLRLGSYFSPNIYFYFISVHIAYVTSSSMYFYVII